MSEAKLLKIKSSLALKMERHGGRSFAELERRADEATESHRERVMASVGDHLDQLGALCASADAGSGHRVYTVASGIVDVVGYFETGPLYEAAYSLCDTVERMMGSGAWSWPSVEVHHRALVLILGDNCRSGQASEALLKGLRAVAQKALGE